jgi:threonine dehydrogenase-like Zn-dependent dehydrogenase
VAAVAEATAGRGAEAVIEAVGLDQTIIDAISMTAVNGTVSVIGVNLNMALPFPMGFAFLRSITVRSTIAAIPGTWGALIPLLESGGFAPKAPSPTIWGSPRWGTPTPFSMSGATGCSRSCSTLAARSA